jgi:hypothetical protein
MTARLLAALCAGSIIGGCDPGGEKCGGTDVKYYDQALTFHLTKAGVPYRVERDGMVCVAKKHTAEFVAAERKTDESFHEVANLLKDSCEESAFVAWATKEKRRVDIRQGHDANRQPSGRLFLIRSFTREELAANADKLQNQAPKDAACKK